MTRYLFQRGAGSYFYKRRVPRDLRHRFAGRYIERNIGRVSAARAGNQGGGLVANRHHTYMNST